MKYYLRFGNIPESGFSNIYKDRIVIGKEIGVSVYDVVLMTDGWHIILPKPITITCINTLSQLVHERRPVYILSGKEVGIGTDKEPLLENPKILLNITENFWSNH